MKHIGWRRTRSEPAGSRLCDECWGLNRDNDELRIASFDHGDGVVTESTTHIRCHQIADECRKVFDIRDFAPLARLVLTDQIRAWIQANHPRVYQRIIENAAHPEHPAHMLADAVAWRAKQVEAA